MLIKDGKKFYTLWEQVQRLTNWKNGESQSTIVKGRSIFSINSESDFTSLYTDFINGDLILFGDDFTLNLPDGSFINVGVGNIYEVQKYNNSFHLIYRTNLKGSKGDTGSTGATGSTGPVGASGEVYEYVVNINISSSPYLLLGSADIKIQFCADSLIYDVWSHGMVELKDVVSASLLSGSQISNNVDISAFGQTANSANINNGIAQRIHLELIESNVFMTVYFLDLSIPGQVEELNCLFALSNENISFTLDSVRKVTPNNP